MAGRAAVLVPAAGSGRRFGGPLKQFRMLGDAPILVQTLRAFDRHDAIDELCVALPQDCATVLIEYAIGKLKCVVKGGATRRESVCAALAATDASVILVHDAVRPFVEARIISEVVRQARDTGAAAAAIPVSDTVRYAENGQFSMTVDRRQLYRMQTPQGFRRDVLEAALEQEAEDTDEVQAVVRMGQEVHLVEGSPWNFKITCPADLAIAEELWGAWQGDQVCA